MNKLEELHIPHAKNWDCYNDEPLKENHALASALITKDISLKYLNFIEDECYYFSGEWCLKGEDDMITKEELFKHFIKTL